jgi:hypothetical protein
MLRESTFLIGGALVIALGVALAAGLVWSGAGWAYFNGWIAAGIAIGLGAFFVYVARQEGRVRREFLASHTPDSEPSKTPRP